VRENADHAARAAIRRNHANGRWIVLSENPGEENGNSRFSFRATHTLLERRPRSPPFSTCPFCLTGGDAGHATARRSPCGGTTASTAVPDFLVSLAEIAP